MSIEAHAAEGGRGEPSRSFPPSRNVAADAWVPGTGLRSREIDALKGCLIVLIAYGHNIYFGELWPNVTQSLYNFHVISFLLLPFIFPGKPLTRGFVADRAVRYLVPHYAFLLLSCGAYGAMFVTGDQAGVWLRDVGIALLVGSTAALKLACGFQLFWFLPALLSVACLRALWTKSGWPVRSALLLASVAVCAWLPWMSEDVKHYTPLGILPALVAFPLGLASAAAWRRLQLTTSIGWRVLPFAVWAAGSAIIWHWGLFPRIGSLDFPKRDAWAILVNGGLVVGAMVSLFIAAPALARVPGLATLGRVSIQIFLIHGLVFAALRLLVRPLPWASEMPMAIFGAASLVATLLISAAFGLAIARNETLMQLLFPRNLASWAGWRQAD